MAIVLCRYKRGYEGYQGRWAGKTKYFSTTMYGEEGAYTLAENFVKAMKIKYPFDISTLSRYKDNFVCPHLKLKVINNARSRTVCVQTWIPSIVMYRQYSISKHGLEKAIQLTINERVKYNLPSPDLQTAITTFKKVLGV